VARGKSEILEGITDSLASKSLAPMGPSHGWEIPRRIEQLSKEALQINQRPLDAFLGRPFERGWISGAAGTSNNIRKAKFHPFTKPGRKQLWAKALNGEHVRTVIGRIVPIAEQG
jgi:hypothetical protein